MPDAWSTESRQLVDNAFALGKVWHRRTRPRAHRFVYRLYYTLFDVEQVASLCARSRWWSLERFNLVSFRRRDYLGDPAQPLAEAVRQRVFAVTGEEHRGQVLLLTHLRQWGVCFNPVSFYLCLDDSGRVAFIVADVHNTPWNQRHAYVLDARHQAGPEYRFQFAKAFHVSPFLPMKLDYDWRFRLEPERLDVHMLVMDGDAECFAVGMGLELKPLSRQAMRRMPLAFPFMTARVILAIYWQALQLWLRRVPFFTHPDKQARQA